MITEKFLIVELVFFGALIIGVLFFMRIRREKILINELIKKINSLAYIFYNAGYKDAETGKPMDYEVFAPIYDTTFSKEISAFLHGQYRKGYEDFQIGKPNKIDAAINCYKDLIKRYKDLLLDMDYIHNKLKEI